MATSVLERRGSSKDIWKTLGDKGEVTGVYFVFSDRVSVFDVGPLPVLFPGLGQLRCAISGRMFQALNSAEFNTHYVSHDIELARMDVKPINIPAFTPPVDYGDVAVGTMLPVEFLCRRMLTQKFIGRIERGEVDRAYIEKLMVFSEFHESTVLNPPFVECSTKYEDADRYITNTEAAELIGKDEVWLTKYCYPRVEAIFGFLHGFFRSEGGFLIRDGKIEMAVMFDGRVIMVDSISPDELGLIDAVGRLADKNILRLYIIEHYPEWYSALEKAKKLYPRDKSKWPPYPKDLVLPKELLNEYIEKTRQVAEAIGAL
jgi:phosphoribosylaminoimidazole-succinocarboxamide synthase